MPRVPVTTTGNAAVIPANPLRKVLSIQNNSDVPMRWRLGAAVVLNSTAQGGLKLYPRGGRETITGAPAQLGLYAIQDGENEPGIYLDFESYPAE